MNSASARMSASNRRHLVLSLLALAAVGMLLRAVFLQIFHADFLQEQGKSRYLRTVTVPAHRGMILDRNGEPLAASSPVSSVWADPVLALQAPHKLAELARRLNLSHADLLDILNRGEQANKRFVWLRRQLAPELARWALSLDIDGIDAEQEYRRFYPDGEVTSHLLGFTDIDDRGLEGLERQFNAHLQGMPGKNLVLKDRLKRSLEIVEQVRPPEPGRQLVLSIDRRIQYLAYRALKAAVIEHRAAAAAAVVVDVTTGEVLAMVNQPAGNPNDIRQRTGVLLRNRAATDIFEPGSTFKPFIVALALESGQYSPTTPIDTSPGWLQVERNRVRDIHNFKRIDVSQVIVKSSNVGVSKIALSLPPESYWRLMRDLGFGTTTDLGFIGEREGYVPHFTGWGKFEYATHSFGYGISVTALQLAEAYAVIAADGVKRPLSLLRREQPPEQETRVLSAATARDVRMMLEQVVSKQGTAPKAAVAGYRVGGKTGTAHKVVNGRYARDRYLSLFAGIAPISRPQLVMIIVVDEPNGPSHYGGQVAAPVFSQVMAGALRLLNVTPDAIVSDSGSPRQLTADL